jgi:hypothetical protein
MQQEIQKERWMNRYLNRRSLFSGLAVVIGAATGTGTISQTAAADNYSKQSAIRRGHVSAPRPPACECKPDRHGVMAKTETTNDQHTFSWRKA